MANRNKNDKEKEKAEWQLALDLQEKKLLDGIKDACNSISENLKTLHAELNEIKMEINEFKKEVQEIKQKVHQVEIRSEVANKEVEMLKEYNKEMQSSIMSLECKALDCFLRFRGVIKEKGENISEKIIGVLADYLEEQVDEVAFNIESIYRVNSSFATQNKLPRDVVVQFSSKKMKEEIFHKAYKDPLEIEGETIKILKELPKKVIETRKQYKPLVDKLKKLKIRFRWEIPMGVSFFFKGKRKLIRDLEEMRRIMKEMGKEERKIIDGGEEGEIKE